jgi:phosphinothricin acetyltransferase
MIRKATIKDAKAITIIYNYYIKNHIATFVEKPIPVKETEKNIKNAIIWLVYIEDHQIIGYAYASKWKERTAYRFSAETSVYLSINHLGKSIGSKLYRHLLNEIKKLDIHSVIGGISLPNNASQRLHEKFGYKKVAHYKEIGFKFNKWIDVGYWQLVLK